MSLINSTDNIFKKGVIGNVRQAQEDSHDMALQTPNGDVFVVCDGMGGHVGGAKASSLAVESILTHLKAERYADPQMALYEALQFANMQILGFAAENPEYQGMGTTACIVLVQNDEVYIAHVGDSRIYLYLGKEKELHRVTKDHSFVQTLVDAGQITDDEAEHHPNKNRILKALGVTPDLQPSFDKVKPKNGDIFLICTDGLCGMIPDSTIEKVLEHKDSLEERGEMLIRLAMQGETVQPGGQDNCTLELIQIDNSPWPKSEFTSYNPPKSEIMENKKNSSKIIKILAAVIAVIIVGVVGVYGYNKYKDTAQTSNTESVEKDLIRQIDSLKERNENLEKTIQKKQKDLSTTDSNKGEKRKTIETYITGWEKEIEENNKKIAGLERSKEN